MIRLYGYPTDALSLSRPQGETPSLLSCVLQSGMLGAQQHLAVWVGGVSQPLMPDGEQEVCSWQCAPEQEMEIQLRSQHNQPLKAWRGWWRAGAIVHVGTLPLQVFLEGQEQPATNASALPATAPLLGSATLDQRNGTSALHAAAATAVLERPVAPAEPSSMPDGAGRAVEGDLWDVDLANWRQVAAAETREEQMAAEARAEEAAMESAPPAVLPSPAPPSSQAEEGVESGTGPMIAAMCARRAASPAEQEQLLAHLAMVLTGMPARTILVDLRQHTRTHRTRPSREAALGLTKECLRERYGARYWERGGRIPTILRQVSTRPARWHLAISDPQAEGLQELLAQLAQGVSLLIMDSEGTYADNKGSYAGSKRAAVIDFLHEQCPQVTLGACS